ncbi:SAM hydrolase/SAM-dependent halogenase family protein [Salidesulfovibrio brasiliensis]|uniref:SAM hydrolase/SAM-dependent halogenase family protein n=1 Tax=Salidesulfovibrio brasiliensis TaxID=221711 RepID=UPI0006D1B7A7|nr:SAM-dependent chlorinase/fluorinase [Salidesulfovibrio brasiliensis]
MHKVIGLLTDFGLSDPYVGQVKAVLAARCPDCHVVDLTHGVEPFNIAQGAFFLASSAGYFPGGSVLLGVVDPGVGSKRRMLVARQDGLTFVAPDNGLACLALDAEKTEFYHVREAGDRASSTFHGRDIFAPIAARLASGESPESFCDRVEPSETVRPLWSEPLVRKGQCSARVLHVDRFGNCVLNLRAGALGPLDNLRIRTPLGRELPAVDTYSDLPQGASGLLEGSQGFFEIAVNLGSAAREFGLSMGDAVSLEWEA